ncbi:MAG: peptide-methionine (S)-S-oxide reductase MsrA [Clostridia bacterium]|nr:peptide-methionine (S)-S-oxide reductase MsrA [Clostridia bacterium]
MRYAYFAGGCFWCITPVFSEADGVLSVVSGYCGGDENDPSYDDVKAQKTGHRETVMIQYDENRISYDSLLGLFFDNVDVTDGGGQYIDRGRSYTLAVYYQTEEEKEAALSAVASRGCAGTVAVEAYKRFYPAEEYHQNYYLKNPELFGKEMTDSGRRKS